MSELAKLFCAAGERSALEGIAVKAALTLKLIFIKKQFPINQAHAHSQPLASCGHTPALNK